MVPPEAGGPAAARGQELPPRRRHRRHLHRRHPRGRGQRPGPHLQALLHARRPLRRLPAHHLPHPRPGGGLARGGELRRPRDHGGHQLHHRGPPRAHGLRHHRGLPRPAGDPAADPGLALRHPLREAAAPGAPPPLLRRAGAPRRGRRGRPPPRRVRPPGDGLATPGRGRGIDRRLLPPLLRQSRPRAARRRDPAGALRRRGRLPLLRGGPGLPRVLPRQHHGDQRRHPARRLPLPRAHRDPPAGGRAERPPSCSCRAAAASTPSGQRRPGPSSWSSPAPPRG